MNDAPQTFSVSPPTGRSAGPWRRAGRKLTRSPMAVACVGVIGLYVAGAVFAAVALAPRWGAGQDYARAGEPPSLSQPFGTDAFGRSVLTKTLLGAKVSLTVGLVTNVIAIPLGMVLGAAAGYYGRRIDDVIMWLVATLAAIPGIILVIALKFAFADTVLFGGTIFRLDLGGMAGVCVALSLTFWIGTCRLVRAEAMKIRQLDYVLAARAAGRSGPGILLAHVLPNVMHIGVINFSLGFVAAVMAEVVLSYLGIGVAVGSPSWGGMISAARSDLVVGRWWELTAAVGAMFILVLALNLLGDRLRDALDPKVDSL